MGKWEKLCWRALVFVVFAFVPASPAAEKALVRIGGIVIRTGYNAHQRAQACCARWTCMSPMGVLKPCRASR